MVSCTSSPGMKRRDFKEVGRYGCTEALGRRGLASGARRRSNVHCAPTRSQAEQGSVSLGATPSGREHYR